MQASATKRRKTMLVSVRSERRIDPGFNLKQIPKSRLPHTIAGPVHCLQPVDHVKNVNRFLSVNRYNNKKQMMSFLAWIAYCNAPFSGKQRENIVLPYTVKGIGLVLVSTENWWWVRVFVDKEARITAHTSLVFRHALIKRGFCTTKQNFDFTLLEFSSSRTSSRVSGGKKRYK